MDVFGEVMDAAWTFVQRGGAVDRVTGKMLARLGRTVVRRWMEPDEGIWEPRAGRQHHTHSKMMCWVALDRLMKLAEGGHVRTDTRMIAAVRDEIRDTIERQGYSDRLGSYVSIFDRETVDASLLLLATILASCQGLGLTRMSMPFMLGTIVTPDRDRAMLWGTLIHMFNGWLFSGVYALVVEALHRTGWWLGALMGLGQGLFILTVVMTLVPSAHPRMVSEYVGPYPNRRLQPPGFMALNYGRRTPIVALLAHAAFGATLGAFYQLLP